MPRDSASSILMCSQTNFIRSFTPGLADLSQLSRAAGYNLEGEWQMIHLCQRLLEFSRKSRAKLWWERVIFTKSTNILLWGCRLGLPFTGRWRPLDEDTQRTLMDSQIFSGVQDLPKLTDDLMAATVGFPDDYLVSLSTEDDYVLTG